MNITQHGVYMDIFGLGIFITGSSGIGKSELALSLINQGHRLIADDVTEFTREGHVLIGCCPNLLQDFLEVRGLGFLNIRAMFGDIAMKCSSPLSLIINLIHADAPLSPLDRVSGCHRTETILGVNVQKVSIPVALGRNLTVLVEAAVRNQLLKLKGYDACKDIAQRQQEAMKLSELEQSK